MRTSVFECRLDAEEDQVKPHRSSAQVLVSRNLEEQSSVGVDAEAAEAAEDPGGCMLTAQCPSVATTDPACGCSVPYTTCTSYYE